MPRSAEMVKLTKSKTFQAYLPNCHRTYSCVHCRAHLANHDELISKVRAQPGLSRGMGERTGLTLARGRVQLTDPHSQQQ